MEKVTKALTICIMITILTACSGIKVHEDADKYLAKDSLKFVDTIMNNFDKDIKRDDISKKDQDIIADYHEKYIENADPLAYADEEANREILLASMWLHIIYMEYVEIPEDEIDEIMQQIINTIKWHVENGNKEAPSF